jgi:hypothetical protein
MKSLLYFFQTNIYTSIFCLLICSVVFYPYTAQAETAITAINTEIYGDDSHSGGQKGPFPIGFNFEFYDSTFSEFNININGALTFGGYYTAFSNNALNSAGQNNTIFPFWDDLTAYANNNSAIYYVTIGTAPNRKTVVQWTNMFFFGTSIQMGTFQVILYEGTNQVAFQYRDLLGGDRALGNSATIGMKKDNANVAQFSSNSAALTQGQAISFTPNGSGNYTIDPEAVYDPIYLSAPGAPASPTLVNPSDGSTGVTTAPTFEWLPVEGATSYTLLISTASNFSSTVINQSGITATSFTLGSNLNENTTYYWRVQATNSAGSALSPTRVFETSVANKAPNIPTEIFSETLFSGASLYTLDMATMSAILSDEDEDEQVRYRLQIATNQTFTSLVLDYRSLFQNEGPIMFTYGVLEGTYLVGTPTTTLATGTYYLRIRAEDDAAASSPWVTSEGIAFQLLDPPTNPTIISLSPTNNALNIPSSNQLSILFSEAVTVATGSVYIYNADNHNLFEEISVISEQITGSGTDTIGIIASSPFESETSYYVYIDDTAFVGTTELAFAGIYSTSTWNFTIADETSPYITYLSPSNNSNAVRPMLPFIIGFNEPVTTNTGYIYLMQEDTVVEAFSVATSTRLTQIDPDAFELDPTVPLEEQTAYYLLIDANSFVDQSGNMFAGIGDNSTWNFVTADETAPQFVTGTPGRGATNVPVDTPFIFLFNEIITEIAPTNDWAEWAETMYLIITDAEVNNILYAVTVTATDYISGLGSETLTFTLPEPLDYNTTYAYGFIFEATDVAGNTGVVDNFIESPLNLFTTEAAPLSTRAERRRSTTIAPFVVPRAVGFSAGTALSSGSHGLDPRILDTRKLESNADESVVTGMALSLNDPTFTGVSIIPYSPLYDIDVPNNDQDHTLYIRYFSTTGHRSQDFSILIPAVRDTISEPVVPPVLPQNTTAQQKKNSTFFSLPLTLPRSLERGMRGEDVRLLQQVLNALGFTINQTGAGAPGQETDFFGQLTYDAVLRFQTAYADQILAPLGLAAPTGFVGPSTIAQLRTLVN